MEMWPSFTGMKFSHSDLSLLWKWSQAGCSKSLDMCFDSTRSNTGLVLFRTHITTSLHYIWVATSSGEISKNTEQRKGDEISWWTMCSYDCIKNQFIGRVPFPNVEDAYACVRLEASQKLDRFQRLLWEDLFTPQSWKLQYILHPNIKIRGQKGHSRGSNRGVSYTTYTSIQFDVYLQFDVYHRASSSVWIWFFSINKENNNSS